MRVVVVGAGFAGIAAAIRLQERRYSVTLVERRGVLGGRATSFRDAATGDEIDNGTHLLVGACTETIDLLHSADADDLLLTQENLRIDFVDRHGISSLSCPPLIAPLHLVFGLLGLRMPWRARLAALRLGLAIRLRPPQVGSTLASYLERVGQSSLTRDLLWNPLATAILNEEPERADAGLFGRVFAETFLRRARASALVFARSGWGTVAERLGRYFVGRDGILMRRFRVTSIDVKDGRAVGVRGLGWMTKGAEEATAGRHSITIPADAVVAAVPWLALPPLLPEGIAGRPPFEHLRLLASSPIVSIDLWLDRLVVPRTVVGLRDSAFQWVFDKGRLHGRLTPPQHLSFVVSAARRNIAQKNQEIVRLAVEALRRFFPAMKEARVVRSLVMREPHATFACSPEAELIRPVATTPIRGLFVAGDWTRTGLPSTIESAVRSGRRAAESVERG
jgi:squalene-associated FAD-dependent desaturase